MLKVSEKSMPLSKYFQITKAQYTTFQIIPTKTNKQNNSADGIAAIVNKIYLGVNDLIRVENKKLIINTKMKASYYIHITKEEVQFYFIIPTVHIEKFKTKIIESWKGVEIKETDKIPCNINEGTKYQLNCKNNDALSLDITKSSNTLLDANLSTLEILQDDESVGIFYNFIPTSQRENAFFRNNHSQIIEKYKSGTNLKKVKNPADIAIISIKFLLGFITDFISSLQNNLNPTAITALEKIPTKCSIDKGSKEVIKTQIVIHSKAKSSDREHTLLNSLANSYKVISSDDNEIIHKEIKGDIDMYSGVLSGVKENMHSLEETKQYLSIANKELIEEYEEVIDHNKFLELKVPKCLEEGNIRIGTVKYKDTEQKAYYSTDKEMGRLGRVLLGSMGAGKDYYMVNMAKDIIKNGDGLVVIDFIDKCQLAENIKAITPSDKLLEIDCSDPNSIQAFAYNELKISDNVTEYDRVAIAMQKAQQLQILMDSINDDSSKLTPRMLRYFYAGATVVFYKNINASFKQVIDILLDPYKREELINSLSSTEKELLVDEIDDLLELTKVNSKTGDLDNADSKIDGIIDRISWLKTNFYSKLSFIKNSDNNIDFVEAINQNKVILIKIPEKRFNSKMIRNVLATFYLSKVWLAKQQGATENRTELFMNEIHQCYNCQLLMESMLVECRKFNLIPTLAMHYLGQCTNRLKGSIMSSGLSFLLLAGCDVRAYNDLKTHFSKAGYTEGDLVELERYHALCLIKNEEKNYSAFVSKLPE